MPLYPVNLQLTGRRSAIIGGGTVAERKAAALLKAGADITVISPRLTAKLTQYVADGTIKHVAREYLAGDIDDCFIVICATDNEQINRLVAEQANALGVLVNVVDAPELGNFSVPSQMTRKDMLITVSTGGKSPELAKHLREELEELYGEEYGDFLELVSAARNKLKDSLPVVKEREEFWRRVINKKLLNLLRQGKFKDAEERISNAISSIGTQS